MTTADPTELHRYHRWPGELNKGRWTWLVIVGVGVRHVLKNPKTRVFFTMTGGFVLGTALFLYGLAQLEVLVGSDAARGLFQIVRTFLGVDLSGVAQIADYQDALWRSVFLLMLKVQICWGMLMLSWTGPGLIANDLRARALPIYFSKPVTPLTYIVGKWLVAMTFVASIVLVPNLLSLILGAVACGDVLTFGELIRLGIDLLLVGAMICVVSAAVMLALSSLTSDYRYVTVAWLAVCLLPVFAQAIVDASVPEEAANGWLGCISLWDDILVSGDCVMGVRDAWVNSSLPAEAVTKALVKPVRPACAATVLAVCAVGSMLVCYRRVLRFSRSAANL